jgi:hypothetical protein
MSEAITDKPVPTEPELVQCEICLTEIPGSVATTVEGPDYVHHFCGIDCLARWRAGAEKLTPPPPTQDETPSGY